MLAVDADEFKLLGGKELISWTQQRFPKREEGDSKFINLKKMEKRWT
jgi:hypothetical protein